MKENYFMGMDGFVWFTGVVEDRNDPSKLGRVKVRCLGLHTESLVDLPTEDLPWAMVVNPITSASMSGIGRSPTGIVEGTSSMSLRTFSGEDAKSDSLKCFEITRFSSL